MPRTAARVTQADISRAIRAAQQVGVAMAVDILPDGTIRLMPVDGPVTVTQTVRAENTAQLAKRRAPDL